MSSSNQGISAVAAASVALWLHQNGFDSVVPLLEKEMSAKGVDVEAGVLAASAKLGEIDPHSRLETMIERVKPRKLAPEDVAVPLAALLHSPAVNPSAQIPAAADSSAPQSRQAAEPSLAATAAAPAVSTPLPHWTAEVDAHIAAAVKAFAKQKKQAAAAGQPSPKISWTRVAAGAPLQPGHPPLTKAQVKARFAELKASGALKKSTPTAPPTTAVPAPVARPIPAAEAPIPTSAPAPAPIPAPAPAPAPVPEKDTSSHVFAAHLDKGAHGTHEGGVDSSFAPPSPDNVMAAMLARHAAGQHVLGGESAAPFASKGGGGVDPPAPSSSPYTGTARASVQPPHNHVEDAWGSGGTQPPQRGSKGGLVEEDIEEENFDDDDTNADSAAAFVTQALPVGGGAVASAGGGAESQPTAHVPTGVTVAQMKQAGGEMIQPCIAQGLRELLFGVPDATSGGARALRALDSKWVKQGVQMDPHENMRFGIVQHEGGPCGALAALQATTLKHLYFRDTPLPQRDPPHPEVWEALLKGISSKEGAHRAMQFAALAGRKGTPSPLAVPIPDPAWGDPPAHALAVAVLEAFGDIVWRCAETGAPDSPTAVLALPCADVSVVGGGNMTRRAPPLTSTEGGGASLTIRSDGLTERLVLLPMTSRAALDAALWEHAGVLLRPRAPTAVCLVYSAALSRGLGLPAEVHGQLADAGHDVNAAAAGGHGGGVLGDMDTGLGSEAKLIGAHNYATQELVNLLLTGTASSNVHDGEMRLGEGSDSTVLRGVQSRSDVGFLTLFEHYGYMAVGEHYKRPRTPVWVVCSESHYSTLFALPAVALGKVSPSAWWEALGVQGGGGDALELQGLHYLADRAVSSSVSEGAAGRVDLAYYDGLDKQDAPIHFTLHVEGGAHCSSAPAAPPAGAPKVVTAFTALGKGHRGGDDMDTPPLDMVLRTRWSGAKVEWNATEPLL